jgi:DNA (cytosine-5)-methyltransferase 1
MICSKAGFFVHSGEPTPDLPDAVTCGEALGDLQSITEHLSGKKRVRVPRFDKLARYQGRKPSAYAELMRSWPGYESQVGVCDHVIRQLRRDIDTFREMPCGGEYPAAHATAMAILKRHIIVEEFVTGRTLSSRERDELKKAIVPPYPVGSFRNRWWKLIKDHPSRTLVGGHARLAVPRHKRRRSQSRPAGRFAWTRRHGRRCTGAR